MCYSCPTPSLSSMDALASLNKRFSLQTLVSIPLTLWVSFSVTTFVGTIILGLTLFSPITYLNNDAFSSAFVLAVPCLVALLLYLLVNLFWTRAYIAYIVGIALFVLWMLYAYVDVCWVRDSLDCGMAGGLAIYAAVGVTLASPVAFFAKELVRTRMMFLFASLMGTSYLLMYGLIGFSL